MGGYAPDALLGPFAYGQIREDASIRSSSPNVTSVYHPAAGEYCVNFSNSPSDSDELEGSVVGHAGSPSNPVFLYVTNGQVVIGFSCQQESALQILVMNSSGTKANARFSFIVP